MPGAVEELFDAYLKDKGYLAMASAGSKRFSPEGKKEKREGREWGQSIDATIVPAQKQHNSRAENETIKEGKAPEDWKSKPAKNRQKGKDARWTKKHERSYSGHKNHLGVDRRRKFVRRYVVSGASVHDSQKFEDVLDASNTGSDVWAERAKGSVKRSLVEWRAEGGSAYRSTEIEEKLGLARPEEPHSSQGLSQSRTR